MSTNLDRLHELERIIVKAMEMCTTKKCSKAEVLDVLASADVVLTRDYDETQDDEYAATLDDNEYTRWFAQEPEHTVFVACGDD